MPPDPIAVIPLHLATHFLLPTYDAVIRHRLTVVTSANETEGPEQFLKELQITCMGLDFIAIYKGIPQALQLV